MASYVVYPSGKYAGTLATARKIAKTESLKDGAAAAVMNSDTQKVVVEYFRGEEKQKRRNPAGMIWRNDTASIKKGNTTYVITRFKPGDYSVSNGLGRFSSIDAVRKAIAQTGGVKRNPSPVRVVRNTEGFRTPDGVFHPIRAGADYDERKVELGASRSRVAHARGMAQGGRKRTEAIRSRLMRNPSNSLPVGKFIPASSVRVNADGTVDVVVASKVRNPERTPDFSNLYIDKSGVIRWTTNFLPVAGNMLALAQKWESMYPGTLKKETSSLAGRRKRGWVS
jgi:hypothetical protein